MRFGRRKLLWTLGALVVLLCLYAAFGFWVAPGIVRRQATDFVREKYGRTLSMGEVRVHPFKLYVEVKDVVLPDRDGQRMVAFERSRVDFQALSSLRHWAYVLREVSLVRQAVRAVVRPDGTLNLQELAPRPGPRETAKEPAPDAQDEATDVWIQNLTVSEGSLDFVDRARPREFRHKVAQVSLTLRDFRTTAQAGRFGFRATGEGGASLRVRGEVGLVPEPTLSGSVHLSRLGLPRLAEYLASMLPLEVPRGTLSVRAAYHVRLGTPLRAKATVSKLLLDDVALQARGAPEPWVRVQRALVRDAGVVLEDRRVEADALSVHGLTVEARLEPGGELNLARLISAPKADHGPHAADAKASSAAPTKKAADERPWRIRLHTAQLTQASVHLEDQAIAPGTKLTITPIRFEASELSHDLKKPIPVRLQAAFDEGRAELRVTGDIAPAPLAGDLALELEGARLALAQPYIDQYANLIVHDGVLRVQGKLAARPQGAPEPELLFEGGASLEDLHTVDALQGRDFFNAARIEAAALRYTVAPDALSIARVDLVEPYARVVLSSKQVLNVASVFERPARKRPAPDAPSESANAEKQGSPERAAMPVHIDAVHVEGMQLSFSDYFIKPNFAAEIKGLHGTVRGLSTDRAARAKVALRGELGANAPVSITGRAQPFAFDEYTDLTLRSSNIELAVFNPYSGRFAGYNIERGELTTYIRYIVRERKLSAEHKLRIDQLVWGEATGSKQAAPLPVKLATVLLRDRNGVITLDVPVEGSLDEPGFRVGPFIWQAIQNTLTKVISAPFRLLGAVFQGAEEARYITFAPGDATLDASAQQALAALAKAMRERPELRLLVPVAAAPEDRAALVERKYRTLRESTMQTALRRLERRRKKSFDDLGADQKSKVLSSLYEEVAGKEPKIEAPSLPKDLSRGQRRAAERAHEVAYLEREVRDSIRVEQSELDALGRQRAQAIERALLQAGELDSTRVMFSQEAKVTADEGKVRLELGFD